MVEKTREELIDENEKYRKFFHGMFPDKFPGHMFICGASTEVDSGGLPESVIVCAAFGSDYIASYRRVRPSDEQFWRQT